MHISKQTELLKDFFKFSVNEEIIKFNLFLNKMKVQLKVVNRLQGRGRCKLR